MAELQRIKLNQEMLEMFSQLSAGARSDAEFYACPRCRDSGWLVTEQGARPCDCGKESRLLKMRREAGLKPAMDEMCFSSFDLRYYSPERQLKPGYSYRLAAEKALRAAKVFVAACLKGETTRGLYYEGNLGSGKTFLAAAITGELLKNGYPARFVVVPEFFEQLRLSYRGQESNEYDEAEIMRSAMTCPVLVLDDLGAHNSSAWTVSKLYTLLNYRLNSRQPCIITSNLKPTALAEELGSRAASRIKEMCDRYILLTEEDIRGRKEGAGSGWQI
jgi:DNA replication protein DnaC